MEEKFIAFVADVMQVEPTEISLHTTYKEFAKWDSMMMLNLVLELEQEYGVSIPMESLGNVKQLKDLYAVVCKE